ncbi:MAG TPA: hypothetical protein VGX50_18135, partial [Longimicrobium sp.]|nr:hypothetical protein [Longimicrobium sp.]
MPRIRLVLAACALAAAPAAAQARYLPQPDTLYYESLNPYHMYVVRGRDTLMDPVIEFEVQRQAWRAYGEGLEAEVHSQAVDGRGTPTRHLLQVTPRGVVAAFDGRTDHPRADWDQVLRLPPDGDLRPGRTWADTLDRPGEEAVYQVWRELRVERVADTLGSRMAVVRGTGRVRYRDAYPYSGGEGRTWWIDVAGPVQETFLFDTSNGRMAVWEWNMDLRGSAGLPAAGSGTDTVPAGLRSRLVQRLVTPEHGRLLLRGLPAGDTTLSRSGTENGSG